MQDIDLQGKRIGFAVTGSFCTLEQAVAAMRELKNLGAEVLPIASAAVQAADSRFGTAAHWREELLIASGAEDIIGSVVAAEPIGPKRLIDLLIIAPCTSNTLAKLAHGVNDDAVTMAAKSHLRNGGPVLIGISTNDGLSNSAANIARLLERRQYYFIPFGQDDAAKKPNSLVADFAYLPAAAAAALAGQQHQPLLIQR